MQLVDHYLFLDLLKNGVQSSIDAKRGEVGARKIIACLVNGSCPYYPDENTTVQLRAIKPSGMELYNNAEIDGAVATINITSQLVAEAGTVKCQLSFIDEENNLLFSPRFEILVEDCLYSDEAIESTNEYSALAETKADVEALKTQWSNATATAQSGEDVGVEVEIGNDGVNFAFVLPKGDKGDAGVSVSVGTTTTAEAGTDASVTNSGTASDPILNFVIPKGEHGERGEQGEQGLQGAQGIQGVQGEKGDPGDVQTIDGVSPDALGNVALNAVSYNMQDTKANAQKTQARANIGAAADDVFSRNGSLALSNGCKGIDIRPFPTGISLGIGTAAPDSVNGVDIADTINPGLRIAIGAPSNFNLLDNWYFRHPVNQRGLTSYSDAGYGIDRWRISRASLTINANASITITSTSYDNNFAQFIEPKLWDFLVGKTLTLSVKVLTVSGSVTVAT